MPKRIENVPGQLLEEAGRQVAERGYAKTTVRSVAAACGIAVGTVYNYFPSKQMLVASYMARDWKQSLAAMAAGNRNNAEACLHTIYEELAAFTRRHRALFADPEAARAVSDVIWTRHLQLREQLAALIEPFAPSPDGFTAAFLAEALLTWTVSDTPFEQIYGILSKLIPEHKEDHTHEQL